MPLPQTTLQDVEDNVLRVSLLGGFQVSIGSRVVKESEWRIRKAKGLIKLLALAPSHRLRRTEIVEYLWAHQEVENANSLHQTLYIARHALEPTLGRGETSAFLHLQGESLLLKATRDVKEVWTDVEAFEIACADAHYAQEQHAYDAALRLYIGDLLPEDLAEDWTIQRRYHLRELYLTTLLGLAHLYERQEKFPLAIQTLETLITNDPLHEEARCDMMRLLVLSGKHYQALRHYQLLREALHRELGVSPSAITQRFYDDIMEGRFPEEYPTQSASGMVQYYKNTVNVVSANPANTAWPLSLDRSSHIIMHNFVGRDEERTTLKQVLSTTRLLNLTGTGGCGKTWLARKVANEMQIMYAHGICVVELSGVMDSQLVMQAVVNALGIEKVLTGLLEALITTLHSRQLLLVLDNCEHLLAGCVPLIQSLLASCPQLSILVTSRQRLHINEETVWHVPSLFLPDTRYLPAFEHLQTYDAVHLFVERAHSSSPDFVLTPQNAHYVVQICHRLDGLPLAIELAAILVRNASVAQIASRLDDCFSLLPAHGRTILPRHQTLRATIDWSYSLLTNEEQKLFRALSVFTDGWSLEAAECICAYSDIEQRNVLRLLSQLTDKSLIVVERQVIQDEQKEQVRHRLLETLRQYGIEKLHEAEESVPLYKRYIDYYVQFVKKYQHQKQEYNNIQTAFHLACTYCENERHIHLLEKVVASQNQVVEDSPEFQQDRNVAERYKKEKALTLREREIVMYLAKNLTNRQIAKELQIAERTVDTHVNHVLSKLALRTRKEVIKWVQTQSSSSS